MCFNISLTRSAEILEKEFHASIAADRLSDLDFVSAFTFPFWPALTAENSGVFRFLQWGLIPYWEKNMGAAHKIRSKTLNARFETLGERVSFRSPADYKRCAVVVDSYFEWKDVSGKKYPYRLHLPGKAPFLLAGIWDRWVDKTGGDSFETFSIVTTAAYGIAEEIHNTKKRMPFILDKKSLSLWLDRQKAFKDIRDIIVPSWQALLAEPFHDYKHRQKLLWKKSKADTLTV